jgi:hypothetical protein
MQPPLEIPGNRDVAPEAVLFHAHAEEFGLPLPFEILPISDLQATPLLIPPHGATTFAYDDWDNDPYDEDPNIFQRYDDTFGVHTGVDYGGTGGCDSNANSETLGGNYCNEPVIAICDGVVVDGRIPRGFEGEGGGTAFGGWGVSLRCFAEDREGDGTPNLSNIVVVYNHLLFQPDVALDEIVNIGDRLGVTGGDELYDHLHLEMFLARAYLMDPSDPNNGFTEYVRINPFMMYSSQLLAEHNQHPDRRIRAFYPIQWSRNFQTEPDPNFDLESPGVCNVTYCVGIYRGDLNIFTEGGQLPQWSAQDNFWREQDKDIVGVEWPGHMFTNQDFVPYLLNEYSADPFEYPNCIVNAEITTCPSTDLYNRLP